MNTNTQFKKGMTPWNKGKINCYSEQTLKSNAEKHLGKVPHNKGKTWEEQYGEETAKIMKENMKLKNLGKKHSNTTKFKISSSNKGMLGYWLGKKMPNYIGLKKSFALKGKSYEELCGIEEAKRLKLLRKKERALLIFPVKDTSIEIKIQDYLKQLEIPFFTHQYMNQIKHSYQCDILIPCLNMVIECDGDYWHHYPIGNEVDHIRTSELLENGFKVLRLWEHEIREMTLDSFKLHIFKGA